MKFLFIYIVIIIISIGMIYIIIQNKKFNSFDPTKVVQPIGTVICFAGINIPSNYMLCDGTKLLISEYSDLFKVIGQTFNQSDTDSTLYFNLPDFRGVFLRGLDNGKGKDVGRVLGSYQNDSTKLPNNKFSTDSNGNHTHSYTRSFYQYNGLYHPDNTVSIATGLDNPTNTPSGAISAAGSHSHIVTSGGDLETRPINISINYIIKIN